MLVIVGSGRRILDSTQHLERALLLLAAGGIELRQTFLAEHLSCTPVACCQHLVVAVWSCCARSLGLSFWCAVACNTDHPLADCLRTDASSAACTASIHRSVLSAPKDLQLATTITSQVLEDAWSHTSCWCTQLTINTHIAVAPLTHNSDTSSLLVLHMTNKQIVWLAVFDVPAV